MIFLRNLHFPKGLPFSPAKVYPKNRIMQIALPVIAAFAVIGSACLLLRKRVKSKLPNQGNNLLKNPTGKSDAATTKDGVNQSPEEIRKALIDEAELCFQKFDPADSGKIFAENDEELAAFKRLEEIYKDKDNDLRCALGNASGISQLFNKRISLPVEFGEKHPFEKGEGSDPYIFDVINKCRAIDDRLTYYPPLNSSQLALKNSKGETLLRVILNLKTVRDLNPFIQARELSDEWMSNVCVKGIDLRVHDEGDFETSIFLLLLGNNRVKEVKEILNDEYCKTYLEEYFTKNQKEIIEYLTLSKIRQIGTIDHLIVEKMLGFNINIEDKFKDAYMKSKPMEVKKKLTPVKGKAEPLPEADSDSESDI